MTRPVAVPTEARGQPHDLQGAASIAQRTSTVVPAQPEAGPTPGRPDATETANTRRRLRDSPRLRRQTQKVPLGRIVQDPVGHRHVGHRSRRPRVPPLQPPGPSAGKDPAEAAAAAGLPPPGGNYDARLQTLQESFPS